MATEWQPREGGRGAQALGGFVLARSHAHLVAAHRVSKHRDDLPLQCPMNTVDVAEGHYIRASIVPIRRVLLLQTLGRVPSGPVLGNTVV